MKFHDFKNACAHCRFFASSTRKPVGEREAAPESMPRPKCCARIENNASAPRLRNGVTPQELLKQKLSPQSRPLNFRSAEVRHEVRPQASSSPSANRLLPSSQANSRPRLHHHHHLPRQQQRPRPAPSGGLRCRHRPEMSSR